jgi:hypothetical protein
MKTILVTLAVLLTVVGSVRAADEPEFTLVLLENLTGRRLSSYTSENAVFNMPKGRQTFGGVPFDVEWKLHLHGTTDARDDRFYPTRITGIPIQQPAARLHMIHAGKFAANEGQPVAALRLNYGSGEAHTILVRYGVHTRDFSKHEGERVSSVTDSNTTVVWTGRSVEGDRDRSTHRLYKTTFDLPITDKALDTIDAFSSFSRTSFQIFALTIEGPNASNATRKPARSEDDSQIRDSLVVRVSDRAGAPLGGARVRGFATDGRGLQNPLGRNDDSLTELGVVPMDFPADTRSLQLVASLNGYVPTQIEVKGNSAEQLRRELSVKLDAGVRIGGTVSDVDGEPLAKAKVQVLQQTHEANGRVSLFEYAEVTTDTVGKWRTREVPDNFDSLLFRVTHKEYRTTDTEFSGEGSGTLTRSALLGSKAQLKVAAASTLAGVVEDEAGRPIVGANLSLTRSNNRQSRRTTDEQGTFSFGAVDTNRLVLTAKHNDFAVYAKIFYSTELSGPLKVTLGKGVTFRGRVMEPPDDNSTTSQPLSRVTVSLASMTNSYVRWQGTTDVAGRFVWNHAPPEDLQVILIRPGFASRGFTGMAGTNENQYLLAKALSFLGSVVDAETKAPVEKFRVTPGDSWGSERYNWRPVQSVNGTNGQFFIRDPSSSDYERRILVKVEAPGYWPQQLFLTNAAPNSNHITLQRGTNFKGMVKLPDGSPAAGAEVATVGDSYLALSRATFTNRNYNRGADPTIRTDRTGHFEMPPRLAKRIIAVHEQGYGEVALSNLMAGSEIKLEPWGTIEGTLMIGNKVGTNCEVKLNEAKNFGSLEYQYGDFSMMTDHEGKFRFTHVPPGARWLIRLIPTHDSSRMWSHYTPVDIQPGKVTKVTVGGTGRAVIGKVVPDDLTRIINWRSQGFSMNSVIPKPNSSYRTAEEYRAWNNSPEVRAATEKQRHYAVTFADDGTFRVDDVPAGKYEVNFYFNEPRNGNQNGSGSQIGNVRHEFEISEMSGGRSDEPFDLGTLVLKTTRVASR